MATQSLSARTYGTPRVLPRRARRLLSTVAITGITLLVLAIYLMPFAYMAATSLKDRPQLAKPGAPLWPVEEATYTYQGEAYPIYNVPTEAGMQRWALIDKGRERSTFIDPANPDAGPIEWVGRWRTLQPSWSFSARWENFSRAWTFLKVPRVLWNTFAIAALGDVGTLIASTLVAYGFARFRFPGRDVLFLVLIATIILPRAITLIPTYAFFVRIGWVGTWLPLIVPHFFANAYNVFLLRQYMLTIPRELDEAAMIDGANPFRILTSVILPQCLPALVAVGLFHFVFAWNDFLEPMVYLSTVQDKQPISIAIQLFNARYFAEPYMVQATSLIGLAVPVLIFLLSQRVFLQGVVITGVEK